MKEVNENMEDATILALAAMILGVAFGAYCVSIGINSGFALAVVAGIFGVAGYELKAIVDARKG